MSHHVATYPTDDQYKRWQARAEEMDMSMSEWTMRMVEAGTKKFERTVEPDETKQDLRKQRNDLRNELTRTRERMESLEQQLHQSERQAILDFLAENPGAEYRDIVQHIINTANGRVTSLLSNMEDDELHTDADGGFYRTEGGG